MLEPPAAKTMSRAILLRAAGAKLLLARVFEWQKKKKKGKKTERRRRESRSIPPRKKKRRKFRDFDFFLSSFLPFLFSSSPLAEAGKGTPTFIVEYK